MGRILVPTVDVDTRLFSSPGAYSHMQNGCEKFGKNGYMSCGDTEDMDLHVKGCSNKRLVNRRKKSPFKNRRDCQFGGFCEEEKYFQFNYTSSDLNDMSTPLIGKQV